MAAWADIAAYYETPAVRRRISEYGAGSLGYAAYGGRRGRHEDDFGPTTMSSGGLRQALEEGADVCRSLADDGGTLVQLDVDYVNPADPAEPYRDPGACFRRLEPVYRSVRDAFAATGVPVIALMTGKGYHFTSRAVIGSPFYRGLVRRAGLRGRARARDELAPAQETEAAHAGAGRLVESLAHDVARGDDAEVPVVLADVPPPGRGPFVCLDLTAYGDPLPSRFVRTAFSSHQKPLVTGLEGVPQYVVALPREGDREPLLAARQDSAAAARLAARASCAIPDAVQARAWLRSYDEGVLSWFHRRFDEGERPGPVEAAARYAAIPAADLPLCVRSALANPNPGLLVPAALRTVTLVLWHRGWHPGAVADLVRSRFDAPHGWGRLWDRYDPAARSDFYVRLFAGAVVAGLDGPDAFTCHVQQARGACPGGTCGHELGRSFPRRDAIRLLGVGP